MAAGVNHGDGEGRKKARDMEPKRRYNVMAVGPAPQPNWPSPPPPDLSHSLGSSTETIRHTGRVVRPRYASSPGLPSERAVYHWSRTQSTHLIARSPSLLPTKHLRNCSHGRCLGLPPCDRAHIPALCTSLNLARDSVAVGRYRGVAGAVHIRGRPFPPTN